MGSNMNAIWHEDRRAGLWATDPDHPSITWIVDFKRAADIGKSGEQAVPEDGWYWHARAKSGFRLSSHFGPFATRAEAQIACDAAHIHKERR